MSGKVPIGNPMKNPYHKIFIASQNVGDRVPCEAINGASQILKRQECVQSR